MIKKNWKKICVIFFFVFLNKTGVTIEDSDIFLESVLFNAVKVSDYEKTSEFLEKGKATANIIDSEGLLPISYALKNDDETMYQILIKNGADINKNILDKSSNLIFYIKRERFKLLHNLIEDGVNLNFQDNTGMTALMHAIENVNLEAIKVLIQNKKNLELEISDYSGKTVFDYAEFSRNRFVKDLIKRLKTSN
jgi:ankyrin repeat protein|tara:strand:+ start:264 stop:845 length:582 start_codon:yes stop_codon:yes gene_type:complete